MTIQINKVISFTIGMGISLSVMAQQNNVTDRLKNASSRVNELVQANADYMSPNDQRDVLELLRQIRDRVRPNTGSQPGYPNQPPPYPGPQNPNYPDDGISLSGYCDDSDHTQFKLAKDFSYSTSGLNYSSQQSTDWALRYNETHACNTMNEFKSRFKIIKDFAYSTSGLNMSSAESVQFALNKADYTSSAMATNLRSKMLAIKNFAYSTNGLNLGSSESAILARSWIDRPYCEDTEGINSLAVTYKKEYDFAYSTGGLNYGSSQAKEYALNKIRRLSRCGDLLK